MKIVIGHLYGKIMNIYGDRGNILTLVNRSQWRGIKVEVVDIGLGDIIDSKKIDVYFWGGGQDREQNLASADLAGDKGKVLKEAVEEGAALLSICGGYQLLGRFYKPLDSDELLGIGLFDAHTVAGHKRMIGNLVIEHNLDINSGVKTLVGFENHSGKTYLSQDSKPLGRVVIGSGNNGEDRTEGCIYKNAIGCYLHGPVLPKNPHLADFLLLKALSHAGFEIGSLEALKDNLEIVTHQSVITRAKQVR